MKTSLYLLTFSSALHGPQEETIRNNHTELLKALEETFDVHIITEEHFSELHMEPSDIVLVFIASGGTEGMFVKRYAYLPKPLTLLTDGKANSLAASLEISSWVRAQNSSCRILHDDPEQIVEAINALHLRSLMQGERIGVLGEPSDWLISSHVDYKAAEKRWGTTFVDIPLFRVENYFAQESDEDAEALATEFIAGANLMIEPNKAEVIKAVRLYRAIRRIVEEDHLTAVTVRCFNLITSCHTTGCLALSLLNDEGIVAGCEGDVPSIFTMLLSKRLTGSDAFMANPARIRDKEVLFAHCTIGLKQTRQYIIRSHFESNSGVAVQGLLREHRPVTVVKVGGEDLGRIAYASAILTENQNDPKKCRTQILLRSKNTDLTSYLMDRSIGNHHIILQGNYTALLDNLSHAMDLRNEVTPTDTFDSGRA